MGLSGMDSNAFIQSEVTLLSVVDFDSHVNVRLGGLVMARSVKFLGKLEATLTDQETREGWWEELRDEIRSHARSLYCTHIIGYSESCSIYGDVCVLTAEGTGAKVKHMAYPVLSGQRSRQREDSDSEGEDEVNASSSSTSRKEHSSKGGVGGGGGDKDSKEKDKDKDGCDKEREDSDADDEGEGDRGKYRNNAFLKGQGKKPPRTCNLVHVPYKRNRAPFGFMRLVPCLNCKRKWVPETILSTTEPSKGMAVRRGCEPALLEARVCRSRRKGTGETDAVKISEVLPFVEYDLQRQLMLKMRVRGLNAAFGYRSRIKIGENMVVAVASCSVTYLEALPPPPPLQIMQPLRDTDSLEAQRQHKRLAELQTGLQELWAHFQKSTNNNNSSNGAANKSPAAGEGGGSSSSSTSAKSAGLQESNDDDSSSSSSASSSSSSSSSSSATGGSSSSSLESPSSSSSSESSDDNNNNNNNNNEGGLVPSSTDKKEREREKGRDKDRSRASTAASRATDRDKPDRDRDLDDRREQRNDSNRKASRRARLRRMLMDERQPYVVEVDDETDADVIAVLEDWLAPNGVMMANLLDAHAFTHEQQRHHQHYHRHVSRVLNDSATKLLGAGRQISVMRRGKFTGLGVGAQGGGSTRRKSSGSTENLSLGSQLSRLYVGAYMQMCYNLRALQPCVVLGLRTHINVLDDDTVEVLLSGVCHRVCAVPSSLTIADRSAILDSNIDVSRAVAVAGEWGGGYRSRGQTIGATTGRGMHSPDASRTTSVADDNNSGESPLGPTADSIAAALGSSSSSSSTPSSPAPGSYRRRGRSLSINSQGSVDNDVSTSSPPAAGGSSSSTTRAASLIPVSVGSPGSPSGGASILRHFFGGTGDSIKYGDNAGNSRFRHGGTRDTGGEDDADVNNAALNSSRIGAEPLMDPLSVFISPLSFVPGTVRIVLPFFLLRSLSLSYPSIAVCLHSLTRLDV
jgi:hypothetical protein